MLRRNRRRPQMGLAGLVVHLAKEEKMGCIQRVTAMITVAFIAPAVWSPAGVADPTRKLVMEEFMIDSADPGIKLYSRNKRPDDLKQFTPDKTLLFVHGGHRTVQRSREPGRN